MDNIYYVYGLINPLTSSVFYIGYGKGNRMYKHVTEAICYNDKNFRKEKIIRQIIKEGLQVKFIKFKNNLNKENACELEKFYIAKYGTIYDKTGILTNLTKGGEGGITANNKNPGNCPEMRLKISLALTGKKLSEYHKEQLRLGAQNRTIHGMQGKRHKPESREVLSAKGFNNRNALGKKSNKAIENIKNGLNPENKGGAKVLIFENESKLFRIFNKAKEAADYLERNGSAVIACCKGRQVSVNGYKCIYYEKQKLIELIKNGYKRIKSS